MLTTRPALQDGEGSAGGTRPAARGARGTLLGLAILAAGLALDFHRDVRDRDAFSWMDPSQYYDFALGVLAGRERFDAFEVPSLFPFFLMPGLAVEASVPAALWTAFAWALAILLPSVALLGRELGLRTPAPLVALLVMSSPLLVGLSRSLYVELLLSAAVALAFALWLRFARTGALGAGLAFGIALGAGFMLKMTFPLFLALPVAAAALGCWKTGHRERALAALAAAALPVALALGIQRAVFPGSFDYYTSLGNTALPIMYLIGPPERLSWASATYYLRELAETMLLLLTPLLAVALGAAWRGARRPRWGDLTSPRLAVALWLAGPLLLLVLQPVKEPRHVAPCVAPAVLLGVMGIEALPRRGLRGALLAAAALASLLQYALVTRGALEVPYYLDRALRWPALRAEMLRADELARYRRTRPELRGLHWRYDQNIALAGFPANEALALTWQAFPAVVFDLETFDAPPRPSERIPYRRFEDLYLFAAFDTYNRRCGWHAYYRPLSREAVLANAEFLIVNGDAVPAAALRGRFPRHALVASIPRRRGTIHLLRAGERTPYRSLYARAFLARNPELPEAERRVVASALFVTAALAGEVHRARALARELPFLRDPGAGADPPRNIYWIGGYEPLLPLARALARPPAATPRARSGTADPP